MSEAANQAHARIPAIDSIKAAAIVAVVVMHAGPQIFEASSERAVRWLTFAWTPFHVPAFLVLAGFLYYRPAPIHGAALRARLLRLLVPYTIASGIVQALGLSSATSLREMAFQLVTGSTLPIYYFIFMLTWCTLLTWPLSRAPRAGLVALLAVLFAATVAGEGYGRLALAEPLLGSFTRGHFVLVSEFFLYPFCYFLLGWIAAPRRDALARLARERGGPILALSLAGVALFWLADPWTQTFQPVPTAARAIYTLCAIGALSWLPHAIAASRPVRFLSDATLAIYLYHGIFQALAKPRLAAWEPFAATLALACIGLGGAIALALAGRGLLGTRARLVLGA